MSLIIAPLPSNSAFEYNSNADLIHLLYAKISLTDCVKWLCTTVKKHPHISRRFNVLNKKRRSTRLFPNQPRMANYARSRKEGGGGMGVDGVKGGSCQLEGPASSSLFIYDQKCKIQLKRKLILVCARIVCVRA